MKTLTFTLLIFAILSPLFGQAPNKKGPKKFRCVHFKPLDHKELYYRDGEAYHLLKTRVNVRSGEFKLRNAHAFELYTKKIGPEGEDIYKLMGRSTHTQDLKLPLHLIDKNPKGKPYYRIVTVDDDLSDFPRGSFRFINITPITLGIKFNKTSKALKPLQSITIPAKKYKKGGFTPMSIYTASGKLLAGSKMFGQPLGREMILLYPPEHKRSKIKIKYLFDNVPLPTEQNYITTAKLN